MPCSSNCCKGSHRCNMDLPASSPSVRNFRYVGMKSFLNVWPIEVLMSSWYVLSEIMAWLHQYVTVPKLS
uniref:Uncharacterized protein n=1 Tax=Cucumis melo TaxID=3656 RepID=A0A9I9EEK0_CUCME